jgi:peptidoglycan pentaglycine glycine transferase (the first glycine)
MHFMTFDDRDPLWDRWLAAQPTGHVLQLRRWARLKEQFGWRSRLVTLPDAQGGIAAGASILLRRMAGLTLAYAPRGPVVDWRNAAAVADLLAQMQATSRQAGAAVLKLEPNLPDTPANRQLLTGYGLRPSPQTIQPPSTIIVDISVAPDAILAQMKSKWRYNVRLAERKAVRVRAMSRADLPAFHALMAETGVRDHFAVHDNAYYDAAFDLLTPEHAVYLLAEYDAAPLAAIVVALAGDTALYLWGASSERERNRMPNHALQWAGMQWAKARGATRYDLWGIPDPVGQVAQGDAQRRRQRRAERRPAAGCRGVPKHGAVGRLSLQTGVRRRRGAFHRRVGPAGGPRRLSGLQPRSRRVCAAKGWPRRAHGRAANRRTHAGGRGRRVAGSAGRAAPRLTSCKAGSGAPSRGRRSGGRSATRCVRLPEARRVQLLWRQIGPYAPARVAYIPKGPVVDWANPDLVDATLAAVEMQARRLGCIFVKIDPDVREDTTTGPAGAACAAAARLAFQRRSRFSSRTRRPPT